MAKKNTNKGKSKKNSVGKGIEHNLPKDVRLRGDTYQFRIYVGTTPEGKKIIKTMSWKPAPGMKPKDIDEALIAALVDFRRKCAEEATGDATATYGTVNEQTDPVIPPTPVIPVVPVPAPAVIPVAAPTAPIAPVIPERPFMKFKDYGEIWFEEYAHDMLRRTSYERMLQLRGRVYSSKLGEMNIYDITTRDIQEFINYLFHDAKNEKTGEPLSRKTIIHYLSFISGVFTYAVRQDMARDNPCRNAYVPKGEGRDKKEKEIYTLEEVEQLFELLENAPLKYRTFFTLALYTGFRRGELLGLEWKDIDWTNHVISVKRTSNYTKANGIFTDTTKTKKSQRCQKVPTEVMELLERFRVEQCEERSNVGSKWVDSDRLFVKWNGEPMNNNTPYFWFKEFCTDNNFRFCDIHSLRHFYASSLIHANIDPATVSRAMGHSMVSTTVNTQYGHTHRKQPKSDKKHEKPFYTARCKISMYRTVFSFK